MSTRSCFNIVLAMAGSLLLEPVVFAQDQSTNLPPPPPGFATREDYVKSLTSEKDIMSAYDNGLVDKNEALLALMALGNKASVDIYGKVVDQDGQPVAGVKVDGEVGLNYGDSEEHDTTTDANGLFHFLGLHGQGMGIRLQKEGYEYGYKIPYQRPDDYLPDPNNPVIITMWKLRGAEPMVHDRMHAYIPCDGSVTRFDLLTGKQNTNGDLIVKLTRNPVNIVRGKPFNWSVTFAITNGGLQEITNIYPYEAPAEGYEPILTLDFPTNMFRWQPDFDHAYYFKSKDGKIYGRMTISITADFQPPPTDFEAEIYANPAGSRNLEFDYNK